MFEHIRGKLHVVADVKDSFPFGVEDEEHLRISKFYSEAMAQWFCDVYNHKYMPPTVGTKVYGGKDFECTVTRVLKQQTYNNKLSNYECFRTDVEIQPKPEELRNTYQIYMRNDGTWVLW